MRVLMLVGLWAIASTAMAQQKFGDWSVLALPQGAVAMTTNESGGRLVKVCGATEQLCSWMMDISLTCVSGETSPSIASTAAGAAHIDITCDNDDDGGQSYILSPYESVQKLIAVSGRIAIAMPTESGDFRVTRFSLLGSTSASAAVEAIVTQKAKNSTKDLSL